MYIFILKYIGTLVLGLGTNYHRRYIQNKISPLSILRDIRMYRRKGGLASCLPMGRSVGVAGGLRMVSCYSFSLSTPCQMSPLFHKGRLFK